MNITVAEMRINDFCGARGLAYTWQDLRHNARRARIETGDRYTHAATLKAARRIKGVSVNEWTAPGPGWSGCVYLQDAADAERARAAQEAETARTDAWWTANHNARAAGMTWSQAAAYAESLYPTPAAV